MLEIYSRFGFEFEFEFESETGDELPQDLQEAVVLRIHGADHGYGYGSGAMFMGFVNSYMVKAYPRRDPDNPNRIVWEIKVDDTSPA